jgi:hypothetical protein
MNIALAVIAGIVIYTLAVATPIGIIVGRAIRRAERQEQRRRDVEAASARHPSGGAA